MATINCETYRSPAPVSNIIGNQAASVTGLLMVPPFPVSSEPFLAYAMQSGRDSFETVIFANASTDVLPDIDEGDKLHDKDNSLWYIIRGVQEWSAPGVSFLSLLVDKVMVAA